MNETMPATTEQPSPDEATCPPAARIEILVISLAGAEVRRRLMCAQLDMPGLPPHRFLDAVDGRSLEAAELAASYDEPRALRHLGRTLTLPEIGCALSHLVAYRDIVDRNLSLALVLEDDALLGHQFQRVLGRIIPLLRPDKPQAVLLSHVGRYSAWGGRRVDKTHRLYRPYTAYGSHAYLITRAGAQQMLTLLRPVYTVADDWRHFAGSGALRVEAMVPYLVGTAPLASTSQIGDERLAERGPRGFRRWLRKYLWQKLLFQILVKPVLRLRKQESTW